MDTHTSSPWLAQLKKERPAFVLNGDITADCTIVGAGIAGVSTAYHLLKNTKRNVLLLDAGRIAHGATGRNAGQVVNYFERTFKSIVEAFGEQLAVQGYAAVESAWDILEDILHDCSLETPLYMCAGYDGFCSMGGLIVYLEEQLIREKTGLKVEPVLLRADDSLAQQIPEPLRHLTTQVPHDMILKILQTQDESFFAVDIAKKGCINTALFCEELVMWMLSHYPERFRVAEHIPVETVTLRSEDALLTTPMSTITTKRVILCTNGFENFTIQNQVGGEIDVQFHRNVQGVIGYMAGYADTTRQPAAALCYYPSDDDSGPYYYLTRRPFPSTKEGSPESLVCIGGPERVLPDCAHYDPNGEFPADLEEELDRGLREKYADSAALVHQTFLWQGLMGYTPNLLRRIGIEPKNPVLLYNLGCNGVGILSSLYGGKRIAQLIAGIKLPRSIFDVENASQ